MHTCCIVLYSRCRSNPALAVSPYDVNSCPSEVDSKHHLYHQQLRDTHNAMWLPSEMHFISLDKTPRSKYNLRSTSNEKMDFVFYCYLDTWVHLKLCNARFLANSHERRRKNSFFCARHDAISEKFTSCLHHTSLRRKRRHACVVPPVPTVCIVNSQANNTHSLHYVCTGGTTHACLRFDGVIPACWENGKSFWKWERSTGSW